MKKNKITFFLEGLEHYRFIEEYILGVYKQYDVEVVSFDKIKIPNVNFIEIGRKDFTKFMLQLNTDYFITTTPGIGSNFFPKSITLPKKNRPKYIYVFHSLVSPNEIYLKNSFSGYDCIFSPNDIISEQLKNFNKKKIITIGYPLSHNQYYHNNTKFKKQRILIAPSWGKYSLTNQRKTLNELIQSINLSKYDVVLRPHPMELDLVKEMTFGENVYFDNFKDLQDLSSYSHLITDWSGIGIEYSLTNNRKSIYIELKKKIRRKIKVGEKKLQLIENKFRHEYGINIERKNIFNISNLLEQNIFNIDPDSEYFKQVKGPIFNHTKLQSEIKNL